MTEKEAGLAYPGIFVEELKETPIDFRHDSRYPSEIRTGKLRSIAG
jgi:hypothetical protein